MKEYPDGSGGYTQNGYFHGFGTRAHLADDGRDIPVTYAIIELEDGRVKQVEPTIIIFVDDF